MVPSDEDLLHPSWKMIGMAIPKYILCKPQEQLHANIPNTFQLLPYKIIVIFQALGIANILFIKGQWGVPLTYVYPWYLAGVL